MTQPKAFLFDLNGTMIDDMDFHINAWHEILNGLGANISLERVKEECYGKNGELLERVFPGRFSEEEKTKMSYDKETAYQVTFRPSLKLLDGLDDFLARASDENIPMAIGSAAIIYNIDFVLDGLNIRHYFPVIVAAENVAMSKPDPETYLKCADQLGVSYGNCIVFEDAPKGVEAAKNAGMQCVVLTTMHTEEEFSRYDNIICFVKDYTDTQLNHLFQ
ncbi:MAG: HAD family phosphatase [Bacteroidota bacterium]